MVDEFDPRPEATPQEITAAVQLALEMRGLGSDADVLALIEWLVACESPRPHATLPVRLLVAAARATKPRQRGCDA